MKRIQPSSSNSLVWIWRLYNSSSRRRYFDKICSKACIEFHWSCLSWSHLADHYWIWAMAFHEANNTSYHKPRVETTHMILAPRITRPTMIWPNLTHIKFTIETTHTRWLANSNIEDWEHMGITRGVWALGKVEGASPQSSIVGWIPWGDWVVEGMPPEWPEGDPR